MPLMGYYRNELEHVDKGSKRLREVMDGLSPSFFIGMLTIDGLVTYANRTSLEAIGLELKDVLGKRFVETPWWSFSEVYRQQLLAAITKAANGEVSRFDLVFQGVNGHLYTVDFSLSPVRDAKRKVSYLVPSGHDVTERRAAERALTLLRKCNKALLLAQDEITLLDDICQLVVDFGGYRMAWVGYAQFDDVKSIKPIAHAGDEQGYLSETLITWAEDDPKGQGPGGQSIRSGQAVVSNDIQDDVSVYWRNLAYQNGYRNIICLPLRNEQHTFGLLGLYSASASEVMSEEINLLQELADNLAFGITNMRVQQENFRILSAVYKIAAGVSASTGAAFFQKMALNMTEALGAQVGVVTRLQAGQPLRSRTVVAVVDAEVIENFDILIEGTPCESLSDCDEWIIKADVAQRYPHAPTLAALGAQAYIGRRIDNSQGQPIGQLFVLFRQPLEQTDVISSILKIFAARVAAELERQETEVRLAEQASLLDKARDAIIVRDLDHHISFWNKSAELLYGWTHDEVIGCSIVELLYSDPTPFYEATKQVLTTGEWRGEIVQRTKQDRQLIVEGHWSLMLNDQGQPQSIFAINTNITHSKY